MTALPSLDSLDVSGKTVLLRLDLNVPMQGGRVADATRITRQMPTVKALLKKKARVVIISHFGRPEGTFEPSLSLAPLVDALSQALKLEVKFGVDCIGAAAEEAIEKLRPGEVCLLENLRFHAGEESGDKAFAKALASLADAYVNDAFSASHRTHASVVGIAELLPSSAGLLMQEEAATLNRLLANPQRPRAAIVGGSKVSTKLALLERMVATNEVVMIGGAMANTFLMAQGHAIGKSLVESKQKAVATAIMSVAKKYGCEIMLPVDVVTAHVLEPHAPSVVCSVGNIPPEGMIVEVGPATVAAWSEKLAACKTLVWNGPLGAFETAPFDASTVSLARSVARLTREKKIKSIAGGGDTVAALSHAGLSDAFTYLSTAGGAFLEWLEGKPLPGIQALMKNAPAKPSKKLKESLA